MLLSDGASPHPAAILEATRAKNADVEIFTIGINADEILMRAIASSPDHYFASNRVQELFAIFDEIAERIEVTTLFRQLEVEDHIPANMRLEPGSVAPPATETDPGPPLRLIWRFSDVPTAGLTLTYQLTPLEAGEWQTNEMAEARYVDGFRRGASAAFPHPDHRRDRTDVHSDPARIGDPNSGHHS